MSIHGEIEAIRVFDHEASVFKIGIGVLIKIALIGISLMKAKNSLRNYKFKDLESEIAKKMVEEWPDISQKNIASKTGIPQPEISKIRNMWLRKDKEELPIKLVFQSKDPNRDTELERKLKENYNLNDVVVLDTYHRINSENYLNQIGESASNVIEQKVNDIFSLKGEKADIKICASCGKNVFATIMSLARKFENADTELILSSCMALRSDTLIELTPLNIVAQLLNRKLKIQVKNTYQLPEIPDNQEPLHQIINQRIITQRRLGIDDRILHSDIVIFGLGNIDFDSPSIGFMRHIKELGLHTFCKKFRILGEIGYAPFTENYFLFHYLVREVFTLLENGEFKYDQKQQIKKLKELVPKEERVDEGDISDAAKFFSSIFTANFCTIIEKRQTQKETPYILLVVGGDVKKAPPLKILLEKWKNCNVLNGLVTSKNIAKRIFPPQ